MRPAEPAAPPADGTDACSARIVEFVRHARAERFRAGVQESADALRLAAFVGMADEAALRSGLRSLLCADAEDWARFDAFFERFWQAGNAARPRLRVSGRVGGSPFGDEDDAARSAGESPAREPGRRDEGQRVGASARESASDFRLFELNRETRPLEDWLERLARRMRKRLLRRFHARSAGRRIHLRRTVRRSLRYGGVPLDLHYRERRRELPRLVLITDVSRSMNVYSYFFLRFARGIVDAFPRAHAFVFHTRLIHANDALRERDRHRLKEKIAWMAAGWGGGTRIGECLQQFHREHAARVVDSRSFVIIVSDGYDTGAPELLGEQVRRLRRRARRVVWLNPLLGREDYEPVAGGMQAALAHLDAFAPAHNLDSLLGIEDLLLRLS
jgi:uncharacterized protein with von Willebrand factor type A (vWA) domain